MSTFTITPAAAPSFGLPAIGHAPIATRCADAWTTDSAAINSAFAGAADRSYVLAKAGVAFEAKRRNAEGSPAWRSADC